VKQVYWIVLALFLIVLYVFREYWQAVLVLEGLAVLGFLRTRHIVSGAEELEKEYTDKKKDD